MDRISQLHDELLLGILSLLPSAKDVVATMVLSKRWQFLWMMVPNLVYDDSYQHNDNERFLTFVDRSLSLHKAPVIETLHFKLGKTCGNGDSLNKAADRCCVRNLIIEIDTSSNSKSPVMLPRSLYSRGFSMLVGLKLTNAVLVHVSTPIAFPSLKKLILKSIKYPSAEFFTKLLSSCPVLEYLSVEQCPDDNVAILSVRVPSLKHLFVYRHLKVAKDGEGFVIDAPSVEFLKIVDYSTGFRVIENDMSKIITAIVDICYPLTTQLMGSLTAAKRLYLCLPKVTCLFTTNTLLMHSN